MKTRLPFPFFLREFIESTLLKGAELSFEFCRGKFSGRAPHYGAGEVFHHVADKDAQCRERTRERRHEYARDRKRLGEFASVQSARTSKSNEYKVARIVPTLDRDDTQGAFHVGINDTNHAFGKGFDGKCRMGLLEPGRDDLAGAIDVEFEVTAQKAIRTKRPSNRFASVTVGWVPRP